MPAPEPYQDSAALMVGTNQIIGTLVIMTMAFACWIAAAIHLGEPRMWSYAALAAALTLAALALMRPASPNGRATRS
jgi:hypothetical protein